MSLQIPERLYVNRELSWIDFNVRVLESAEDSRIPLFERIRFLSIWGSNLDEFFMIRVGGLYDTLAINPKQGDSKLGMTIEEQLEAIYKRLDDLTPRVEACYKDLVSLLKKEGIRQVDLSALSEVESQLLEDYFLKNIKPFLSPQIIDRHHPFPYLSNKEQFVGLRLSPEGKRMEFGVVPVASQLFPRYVVFPEEGKKGYWYIIVEPLINHFAEKLFKKKDVQEKFIFRITRNGDLNIEEALYDEDIDWRSQVEEVLNRRKRSHAVRLQISKNLSPEMLDYMMTKLELRQDAVYVTERLPLSLNYIYPLLGVLEEHFPDFNYTPMTSLMPPGIQAGDSIMEYLDNQGDIFLYYPFHSMKTFIDLLDEAAVDKKVASIKITLYRLASNSKVAQALIKAAENGKQVVVLVELKARFDEEHNVAWSKRLEEAGCTVLYGMENYKVHSKLCVITRKNDNGVEYITQVGTGNYNEKTARLYTDCSLITKNQDIGQEAIKVFDHLQMGSFVEKSHYLLVAPLQMVSRILDLMDKEIAVAKSGQPAQITIKANGLSYKPVIDKLIEASQAGVKIKLYIRGICCLKAGVPGFTDHVTVKSMVGRFLEHPRIYHFGYGDREKLYISSADMMTRNLAYRVEVGVEILDPEIKNILLNCIELFARDNMLARVMEPNGTYHRLYPGEGEEAIDSQMALYDYLYKLSQEAMVEEDVRAYPVSKPKTKKGLGSRETPLPIGQQGSETYPRGRGQSLAQVLIKKLRGFLR